MSKDKFSIMKTAKRVIAIVTIIILSLAIGYLAYTGSRLAGIQNEANNRTQISVANEAHNAPKSVVKEVANE